MITTDLLITTDLHDLAWHVLHDHQKLRPYGAVCPCGVMLEPGEDESVRLPTAHDVVRHFHEIGSLYFVEEHLVEAVALNGLARIGQ